MFDLYVSPCCEKNLKKSNNLNKPKKKKREKIQSNQPLHIFPVHLQLANRKNLL